MNLPDYIIYNCIIIFIGVAICICIGVFIGWYLFHPDMDSLNESFKENYKAENNMEYINRIAQY